MLCSDEVARNQSQKSEERRGRIEMGRKEEEEKRGLRMSGLHERDQKEREIKNASLQSKDHVLGIPSHAASHPHLSP